MAVFQEAEEARAELEARGSGLTDATPVLRCRTAIERLQVLSELPLSCTK